MDEREEFYCEKCGCLLEWETKKCENVHCVKGPTGGAG